MKKLSLKESKKRCAELWGWIANNPEKEKNDWPKWKFNGGKYNKVACSCFACNYTISRAESYGIDCNYCFLLNLWFNDKIPKNITKMIDNGCVPCLDARYSAFKLLKIYQATHNNKKVSFYSRKIANYCK